MDNLSKSTKIMRDANISLSDILFIKKSIIEWAANNNPNIEVLHPKVNRNEESIPIYKNKLLDINYSFEKEEEAELIGVLKKLAPNVPEEKLINVLEVINTLLGLESSYNFK